jgi:hypothetical protein
MLSYHECPVRASSVRSIFKSKKTLVMIRPAFDIDNVKEKTRGIFPQVLLPCLSGLFGLESG